MAGKKRARYRTKKEIAAERLAAQGGRPQQMRQASVYGSATYDKDLGYAPGCMDFGVLQLNQDYVIVRRDELAALETHYSAAPVSELVDNAKGLLDWLDWLRDEDTSKDTVKWMDSLRAALVPHLAARNVRETEEQAHD